MDDGRHLLVVHCRDEQLLAADHAHNLPAKQTILGYTSIERTEVVCYGILSLGFVCYLCLAEVSELRTVIQDGLTDVFCLLVQILWALDSIEGILIHLLVKEYLTEDNLALCTDLWGHCLL